MHEEKRKPNYRIGYKYLLNHIEQLEERLDQKDNLIDRIIYYYIDSKADVDERTATREVYKTIYGDEWKNYIEGEYLTKEESNDWFDENHDRYLCNGDHYSNSDYMDLAQWQTGIQDQYINGKIVKAYNHQQLIFDPRRRECQ